MTRPGRSIKSQAQTNLNGSFNAISQVSTSVPQASTSGFSFNNHEAGIMYNKNIGNTYYIYGDKSIKSHWQAQTNGPFNATSISQTKRGIEFLMEWVATDAFHNSNELYDAPKCHPHTQIAVTDIMKWVKESASEAEDYFIMWLFGPAGAGKSAIARTIAELAAEQGLLIGSFFFSRTSATRSTQNRLIATLAYQLALSIPDTRSDIEEAIVRDPAIFNKNLETQIDTLLVKPLQSTQTKIVSSHKLIIIDGLDECNDSKAQLAILSAITRSFLPKHNLPIKFLVASRPEIDLVTSFNGNDPLKYVHLRLALNDHPNDDIRQFFSDKFNEQNNSSRSTAPKPRPPLIPQNPTDTLVESAFERIDNDLDSFSVKPSTTERLEDLRRLMIKEKLDYYIVPSEDAHQSEWVAASDKRREFISGFTARGSAGQAIVTMTSAFLLTDSVYWLQAQEEIDGNWSLVKVGSHGEPQDWIEWIVSRAGSSRIGIDARMISHEKATLLNSKLSSMESKLVHPPQNLVDLIWKAKPIKPDAAIYIQSVEFAGRTADHKLSQLREWIQQQPPSTSSYITPSRWGMVHEGSQYVQMGTLVTSLACIAYILNLRGSDIPYNPLFHSYLFVGLDSAVLFVDNSKVLADVASYLKEINVQLRSYTDLWPFLRRREWGEGKVLITPQTSNAISLMLTHFRFTLAPSHIEYMMSIKNETEIDGMRRAYLRDGVSFVKFLAWLENKLSQGYEITEYEATSRLTEYRRSNKHFMGLAYENISASGPNSALPHYSPRISTSHMIRRDTPYLNDSGGRYYDGTCSTTRTVHFGRPTPEMSDAYTRVLQGHIAVDTAIFPEGTSGRQLDVLARKELWKDVMHGTDYGFGAFLSVHEGPHGFSSNIPLVPGHVITNEPGFYLDGEWGMRIESALCVVRKVTTRGELNEAPWLGFERLTCVPIQTRMVKKSMLTKEEKTWLKDHNQQCYDWLSPFLKEDKRALAWLKRGI